MPPCAGAAALSGVGVLERRRASADAAPPACAWAFQGTMATSPISDCERRPQIEARVEPRRPRWRKLSIWVGCLTDRARHGW
eukprot:3015618-Pyramimonas_sp.AAC.1